MKFRKQLILITAFALLTTTCNSQVKHYDMKELENDKTYSIWHVIHEILKDDTERDVLFIDYDFVSSLPSALKTIVARYTTFVPDYMWAEIGEKSMSQALGNFETLKQAQTALLKDWDGKQVVVRSDYPALLQVRETQKSVIFEYMSMWSQDTRTNEFKISKDGKITYIEIPEPIEYEQYSRKKILDDYSFYRVKLNGQAVEDFTALFLDADNVKSMGINKLDQIIYITQKNTHPDYFVRADLNKHLNDLKAFKVNSLDEIPFISISDETTKEYFREFTVYDKIETTAIKSINSGIMEEYNYKFVEIKLK